MSQAHPGLATANSNVHRRSLSGSRSKWQIGVRSVLESLAGVPFVVVVAAGKATATVSDATHVHGSENFAVLM